MMSRPVRWAYDVQPATGYAIAADPRGGWFRGQLYRAAMPALMFPGVHQAWDPSQPATWTHPSR